MSRTCSTLGELRIHLSRCCSGGLTKLSHRGSVPDRAVKTKKKCDAEALLSQVHVGYIAFYNIHSFEYLGAIFQCDGADEFRKSRCRPPHGDNADDIRLMDEHTDCLAS